MKTQQLANYIVSWLSSYLGNAGMKGFVVGVSGGIDSAVTSSLTAQTNYPVLCVEMSIYQRNDQVNRAMKHIQTLQKKYPNVFCTSVDLTVVFNKLIEVLPNAPQTEKREMSLANTRARLRMTTLYYFASLNYYLVVGTGNKMEDFGIGFYTKYGDGGVDLSPIGDLVKTEVYELGNSLGIIEEIMSAPPMDGLWRDCRTDEDQLGASYPELEWAMAEYEKGKTPEDFSGREKEVLSIFFSYHKANNHKMETIPVCEIPAFLKS